jgi:hypothetical protein
MGTDGNWNQADAAWRKSSASLEHGNCVELTRTDDGFAVRDSKNAFGPVLRLTHIMVFLAGVKAGGAELSS